MCGITGLASAPGRAPPERDVLERMTAVIDHRGPDGDGFHLRGPVALGHRRLAIIDVLGGDNPLRDPHGRAVLMFNGEIYNHLELRAELQADGHQPSSGSDGEVLLHGYLAWGLEGMLRRVRGMYALALHDLRDDSLHLARDPLGIKPMHVALSADGLLFGSEMKSVLEALPTRPRLSRRGVLESACLGFTLAPGTIFEGIESLPPGTWLSYRDGRAQRGRHHELVFEPGREAADPDALWEQLGRSVRSHLMSEVPLGAFLSGGVDSSAVVSAMTEVSTARVDAICVGILEPGMDERPFARSVAQGLGVRLHEEGAEPAILDLMARIAWHVEMPFGDTSAAPTWLVCEAARRHVTVALSGDGGDENFAGYRRTRFDVLEERLRSALPAPLRRAVLGPAGRAWPRGAWVPRPLRAGTLMENLSHDWLDAYVVSMSRVREDLVRRIVRPEWLPDEPLRAGFEQHAARVAEYDPLSRVMAMDFATWLADDILVKVDRMSMAHGLEVRVPLLDTDFVHWAAGLPTDAKLHGGKGKRLFKRALRGRVPDQVLDRTKQGFHLPLARWLRGPVLEQRLRDILAEPDGPAFDVLDHDKLHRLVDEHLAERVDRSTELWLMLSFDAFGRHGPGGSER